jgi:putative ATP-dependent endonuclease of OLD family
MHIRKALISNFKCFEGTFPILFNKHLNIIVGINEAGKSTILEAINLALSGWIYGRYLITELSQSLFNSIAVSKYLAAVNAGDSVEPPRILIELYFEIEDESLKATFEGNGNSLREKASGIQFQVFFNEKHREQYEILLQSGKPISSLPIEYYDFAWSTFARDDTITPRGIPFKAALIDSSNTRLQSGSDIYIARIIRDFLSDEYKIKISQAHRELKGVFMDSSAIKEVNRELEQKQLTGKKVELSIEMSTKNAWESSITTYLDDIPFSNIGKGEQCIVKTKLALSHKKALEANVILLEEPENHLSYGKLNELLSFIKEKSQEKQVIVSTHSSFVANKLGLDSLILLNIDECTKSRLEIRMLDLRQETKRYFEKLAGYDTLRLILSKRAILVEGPSDELVVQKAFMKHNHEKLPIENEIDVISVGTSFLRFLEITVKIGKPVHVVTDNDGDYLNKVKKKYEQYEKCATVTICADDNDDLKTLEPQIVHANKARLTDLRAVLGLKKEEYPDADSIAVYMQNNKTECALRLFESKVDLDFPKYILRAVGVSDV